MFAAAAAVVKKTKDDVQRRSSGAAYDDTTAVYSVICWFVGWFVSTNTQKQISTNLGWRTGRGPESTFGANLGI